MRWGNLLMIALTQWLLILALEWDVTPISYGPLVVLTLSTMVIAGGGYLINDYFDIPTDTINCPNRMWIRDAHPVILYRIGGAHGVALMSGWALGGPLPMVFGASCVLLWLYAWRFKSQPLWGNLLVALLMALAVLLPGWYLASWKAPGAAWIFYAAFAFWLGLIREWVKDAQDRQGDHLAGRKTLPVLMGPYRTRLWLSLLMALTLAAVLGLVFLYPLYSWSFSARIHWLIWLLVWGYGIMKLKAYAWRSLSMLIKVGMLLGLMTVFWIA